MNNKNYIGMLDGDNKIEVYGFDNDWKDCWDRMYKEDDEYRIEDDNVFYVGESEKEVKKKLKEFLAKEILNS